MKKILATLLILCLLMGGGMLSASAEALPELRVIMPCGYTMADQALIDAEISKITAELIGCTVKTERIQYGSWSEQTNVMLASGEEVDVIAIYNTPLSTYVANGQVVPLNDLIAQYGQGIVDAIPPQYLNAGRVAGELYAITTNRDLANAWGFWFNNEMAKKNGIDWESIKTLDDLHDALVIIRDNEDCYPVVTDSGNMINQLSWDALGSANTAPLGVLLKDNNDTTVVNLFESDLFIEWVNRMHQWYEEGLIMPDGMSNTEGMMPLVQAKAAFGAFSHTNPVFLPAKIRDMQMDLACVEFDEAYAPASTPLLLTWAIPTNCKRPELAMQLLNLCYTNKDIVNYYIFGIEGLHYQVIDPAKNTVNYIEGTNAANSRYPSNMGWACFNQFVGYCNQYYGSAPEIWDTLNAYNANAVQSNALGWTFDATNVADEVVACTNVCAKYYKGLMCGALDPAETLDAFNQELRAAGLDDIIAEKQAQLDAWLAAK